MHFNWKSRLFAAGLHILLSMVVGLSVFAVLYWVWFPQPFFELASGKRLFLLVAACDVVLGPLLTLVIFDRRKPRTELRRDLTLIACIQLAALLYGTHAMYASRPVYIVYNAGQFNVTQAGTIAPEAYQDLSGDLPGNPLLGPVVIGAVQPDDLDRRNEIMFGVVEGGPDIYEIPELFVPYAAVRHEVAEHALSAADFARTHGGNPSSLEAILDRHAASSEQAGLLPVVLNGAYAVAVVDRASGEVLAFDSVAGN